MHGGWLNCDELDPQVYTCGICDKEVSSNKGYRYFEETIYGGGTASAYIYICHNCNSPTFFNESEEQIPGCKYGSSVCHLPEDVETIYEEARNCFSVSAFTSSVLCCRKLLMNISCEAGAEKDKTFEFYVNYLNDNGYIPPGGKPWVDKIRKLGNHATHKLQVKSREDAELALNFTNMLLKFIYEFPKTLET